MNPQANRTRTQARRVSELEEREPMSVPEYVLQPNDEALEAGECMGNPVECQCEQCREGRIHVEADREEGQRQEPS
jgi:hypothetical protein